MPVCCCLCMRGELYVCFFCLCVCVLVCLYMCLRVCLLEYVMLGCVCVFVWLIGCDCACVCLLVRVFVCVSVCMFV